MHRIDRCGCRLKHGRVGTGLPLIWEIACRLDAPNVLNRGFETSEPNRKWIADFTYVWSAEDWLHVAAVIDLTSRGVAAGR